VIYDLTGARSPAGGSNASYLGTKYAIDMINERGGVEGYKIKPIYADAQSKAEVAINEAERLLNQEKVDMLMGVFSARTACRWPRRSTQAKRFMWANVCVASAVFKDKNLQYVFRAQVHSDQFGEASCTFLNEQAKARLGKEPKDLRSRSSTRTAPTARASPRATRRLQEARHAGGAEGRLRRDLARPVAAGHQAAPRPAGRDPAHRLQPDITLFLRQAREQGLKWSALIGHGAGYGQFDKLIETFKDDANYIYNVDPVAAQLLDPKTLAPGLGDVTKEMVKRYKADVKAATRCRRTCRWASTRPGSSSPTCCRARSRSTAASTPRRCARRRSRPTSRWAAPSRATASSSSRRATDVRPERALDSPVVMQYNGNDTFIVWPTAIKTKDPVLPLPKGHTYAR
jgi:branched-chain amino acid transport system substrate-binding protein